jgi:hypothetical protein
MVAGLTRRAASERRQDATRGAIWPGLLSFCRVGGLIVMARDLITDTDRPGQHAVFERCRSSPQRENSQ